MTDQNLTEFYQRMGLSQDQYWIGPEHPALEELAIDFLRRRESRSVLEIGYQAGGFAVPVIRALHNTPGFQYTGIDNLSYNNAVNGELIAAFLTSQGVRPEKFRFLVGNAADSLLACRTPFDLVLIDHLKSLYPHDLGIILARNLLAEDGVILLHDVMHKAERPWRRCTALCRLLGYSWELRPDIPAGVAVVRSGTRTPWHRLLSSVCSVTLKVLPVNRRARQLLYERLHPLHENLPRNNSAQSGR